MKKQKDSRNPKKNPSRSQVETTKTSQDDRSSDNHQRWGKYPDEAGDQEPESNGPKKRTSKEVHSE